MIKFYVYFIIKFYNQKFVFFIIFDFHFRDDESKKVDNFLTILIFIVDHIDLFFDNNVINIYFVIQFHFINDFINNLFYWDINWII